MLILDDEVTNIFLICSRNQWRSPTGEQVWKNYPELKVRSAGTSTKARRAVNIKGNNSLQLCLPLK